MTGERGRLYQELRESAARLHELAVVNEPVDAAGWQELAADLGRAIATLRLTSAAISSDYGMPNGQARLLAYLGAHQGEVLDGPRLAGVAGIDAWARRIRELRVEHGWPIESSLINPELPEGSYVLTADKPDYLLRDRWRLIKEVRQDRSLTSGKSRALELLRRLSPEPADQEMLSEVAKINSWQRRLRECDEEGWQIRSNIDEPALRPGSYRLASLERLPERARRAVKLRYEILERHGYSCHDCGMQRGGGRPLQVHHVLPVSQGGTNHPSNLVTLCSACHAGRHALASAADVVDELLDAGHEPAGSAPSRDKQNTEE